MNWYYAEAGKQLGPLEDAEFEALVQAGRIQPDTLVWHEGLDNWQPLRQVRAGATASPGLASPAPAVSSEGGLVCSECGRGFPADQVIQLEGRFVCATCKPLLVQRLREGAGWAGEGGPPLEPDALIRLIRERDYQCNLGAYLSRSWGLVKSNFWLTVGTTLLVLLAQQAPGIVPIVGPLVTLLLTGPLNGGLYRFYLKLMRGQPAGVGDGFAGFGPRFWQLLLGGLIPVLLIYLFLLPAAVYGGVTEQFQRSFPDAIFWVLAVLGVLPMVYFSVCWIFTVPLVMDKGYGFWEAMRVSRSAVSMHWWSVFAVLLVGGLVGMVGVLACCIGVFVTLPVFFGVLMCAYEEMFRTGAGPRLQT